MVNLQYYQSLVWTMSLNEKAARAATKALYGSAERMLRIYSKHELYPYWRMIPDIEINAGKFQNDLPGKKDVVIRVPQVVGRFNAEIYRQLVQIDQKYKDARLKFQVLGEFHTPDTHRVRNYQIFKSLFENQFHEFYEVGGNYHGTLESNQAAKKVKTQIYFVSSKHGPVRYNSETGLEVSKPPPVLLPFELGEEKYKLEVTSLSVVPYIKKIGISSTHPEFEKLINSSVVLPIVGTLEFVETDLTSSDKLIGLVPSLILEHQKHFNESEYETIDVNRLPHSTRHKTSHPDSLASLVALTFGVPPPLVNVVTPYIVEKAVDGEGSILEIPKPDEEIKPILSIPHSKLPEANFRDANDKMDYRFDLERILQSKIEDLLLSGKSLSTNQKNESKFERKIPIDAFRSSLIHNHHITDSGLSRERAVLSVWADILQYLYLEYDNSKFQYISNLKTHLELHESDVKPWDYFILGKFYEITSKQSFHEFIHYFVQYICVVIHEPLITEARSKLIQILMQNITYRLLYTKSMYYYPGISKFYILQFKFDKFDLFKETIKTLNISEDPNKQQNEDQKYITYDIEDIKYDADCEVLFKIVKALTGTVGYTPFYNMKSILKTDSKLLWDNQELIEKAARFHRGDPNQVMFLKFDEKLIDAETKYSFARKFEFAKTTSFYYYRDLDIDFNNLSPEFETKLEKLALEFDPLDSLYVNKKKLLYAFLKDVLSISASRNLNSKERIPIILYVTELVSIMPPDLFQNKEVPHVYSDAAFPTNSETAEKSDNSELPNDAITSYIESVEKEVFENSLIPRRAKNHIHEQENHPKSEKLIKNFISDVEEEVIENTLVPKSRFVILQRIKKLVNKTYGKERF